MLKLLVLVSGGGTNLQALLDQLEQKKLTDVKIEAVISNNRSAYALERAKKYGIPTEVVVKKEFESKELFDEALLALIQKYQPDLVVLAGCLLILPESVVKAYPNQIINIHPSLIPSFCGAGYYGLKVHEAVLARGVKVTGATVHFVDEGCDTGPIILQKAVVVEEGDTPESLQRRVMEQAEWELIVEAVRMIAQKEITVENNLVKRIK
jgi:phosphoribosylglycinamide formyltransferase-1